MSTYCHRIYEIKTPEGNWVALGEITDNFHGFDRWRFKHSDRGLPNDSTVKKADLLDKEDGKEYTYGYSYVTIGELNELANKETANLKEFILKKIHEQPNTKIINRIDFIAKAVLDTYNPAKYDEYNEEFSNEGEYDSMDYFDEEFDEYMQSYDDMCSELYTLSGFCESFKDKYNKEHYYNPEIKGEKKYFIPKENEQRIVYYFD